ncbi:MAG: calcium/sodium antiporter [Acidimicrobiia bacterium]|nr:calcium/sodium antiporter [Acidimicrobiia bacterium]
MIDLLATVAGLLLLARAADWFVGGAVWLADRLAVPKAVVGAVVVGIGTSLPEVLVSGLAAGRGERDIGVGNVIGSNLANLSLVLGAAGLVTTIRVDSSVLRLQAPLCAAATVLFSLVLWQDLTRAGGGILLVALAVAMIVTVVVARRDDPSALTRDVAELVLAEAAHGTKGEVTRLVVGLAGVLAGAQALVWGAIGLADRLGLSAGFVGVTLVAVGTSLPELVTALHAARRGEDELIVGNVLGSNIFNCLAVGGVVGTIGHGEAVDDRLVTIGLAAMTATTVAALAFMAHRRRVRRGEAAALLVGYALTLPLLA